MTAPARGTQLLVVHIGACLRRPGLVALEVLWKWSILLPFAAVAWRVVLLIRQMVETAGTAPATIDFSNPWIAATQISQTWRAYQTPMHDLLGWMLPVGALCWVLLSALGRAALLSRMEQGTRFRPLAMIPLQAAHLALLAAVLWGWFYSVAWAAATHFPQTGEPDLIGYSAWVIFLSLGFFTLWALVSWPFAVAPVVMLQENCSPWAAIARSFRLGKPFTAKLVEIGLVMGIVRLALLVLAMVFSAAPLPFRDELGPETMQAVTLGAVAFYFLSSDLFQVVRLRSFLEFWRIFRSEPDLQPLQGTDPNTHSHRAL